mmetsp:Transcript_79765/g.243891  ORF Transcript_79765/g.243891 Transcript_79765/m.243891 type:complete len:216 (-) Transcript_79765:881-1528(-)
MGTERPKARGNKRARSTDTIISETLSTMTNGLVRHSSREALPALDDIPAEHTSHDDPALYVFAGQSSHEALSCDGTVPSRQNLHTVETPRWRAHCGVTESGGQLWHRVAPLSSENFPNGQIKHEALTDRPGWKVPPGHVAHCKARRGAADSSTKCWPAGQPCSPSSRFMHRRSRCQVSRLQGRSSPSMIPHPSSTACLVDTFPYTARTKAMRKGL